MTTKKTGAELIAAERQRQLDVEGWTAEHDDEHDDESLARAAVCYAAPEPVFEQRVGNHEIRFVDPWPYSWSMEWDKRPRQRNSWALRAPTPRQRIRMLAKAGALIAAEIDRLLRANQDGAEP